MIILYDTASQGKTDVICRRPYGMDVKRTFVEDNVVKEIHFKLREEEVV